LSAKRAAPALPASTSPRVGQTNNARNAETDAMLPRETLARQGPTLDQLGALVAHHGLSGEAHHASDETLEAFRTKARSASR
jgi:hypothetical protein